MASRIEHSGVVERTERDTVYVRITSHSACGSCKAREACGLAEAQDKIVVVKSPDAAHYAAGEKVMVGVRRSAGAVAVILAYVGALAVLLAVLVAAVAALSRFEPPLIIIDMGTATTISAIDRNKNFLGGMIIPGLRVSLDSLTSRTSQLPKISLDPPKKVIGSNTVDCMRSGIIYSTAGSIDGVIDRIEEEMGETCTLVSTGGLAKVIIPYCHHKIIIDDQLLLKGLMVIYNKNRAAS